MELFSIRNSQINCFFKKNKENFLENNLSNEKKYISFKNLQILKGKVYYCQKNQLYQKEHRILYQIISGEYIGGNTFLKRELKVFNYFSSIKKINEEENILQNIEKFKIEDQIENFEVYKTYKKIINFLDWNDEFRNVPIEHFSSGNKSKIYLTLPLFLDYDLYIVPTLHKTIDKFFEKKFISKILELKEQDRTFIIEQKNQELLEKTDFIIDFSNFDEVVVHEDKNFKPLLKNEVNFKNYILYYPSIQKLILSENKIQNLKIQLKNENIFETKNIIFNLSFKSLLEEKFTFKVGISINSDDKTILSQTSPNWMSVNNENILSVNIIIPNLLVDTKNYNFVFSLKTEHPKERNMGKTSKIVENFVFLMIKTNKKNSKKLLNENNILNLI